MFNSSIKISAYSEPFSDFGNIAAEGATKLLGASLTPTELLLRETLQNSWDASIGQKEIPTYAIRLRILSQEEAINLTSFFSELPPKTSRDHNIMNKFLRKKTKVVLEICDFGTKGLGGPFEASKSINENEPSDFINFVKNIGSHRDQINGGGTYGFGKSSLFKMSKCNTILIHTLTENKKTLEHRLIGYSLGSQFDFQGKRFTGRHWWGNKITKENNSESLLPFLDLDAVNISKQLGLIDRNADSEKGTSLIILDPDLDDLGEEFSSDEIHLVKEKLMKRFQEILLWWCWPKFTPFSDNNPPMNCWISIFGVKEEIPNPQYIVPLNLLTAALNNARSKKDPIYQGRNKNKKILGYVGSQSREFLQSNDMFRDVLEKQALIPNKLAHFALLRPAELVVRYEERKLEDNQKQWGGVFICSEEKDIERAFALSEPPAHDDWKPNSSNQITDIQKTYVRSALGQIRNKVKGLMGELEDDIDFEGNQKNVSSVAWLAGDIGRSLIGKGIGGASKINMTKSTKGPSKKRNNLKIIDIKNPVTRFLDSLIVADFVMELSGEIGKIVEIEFKPMVLTEEGKEEFAPNGKKPKIVEFNAEDHFFLSKLNATNQLGSITSRLFNKYTNKDYLEDQLSNPRFELKQSQIKIFVTVEIPDSVVISLNKQVQYKDKL